MLSAPISNSSNLSLSVACACVVLFILLQYLQSVIMPPRFHLLHPYSLKLLLAWNPLTFTLMLPSNLLRKSGYWINSSCSSHLIVLVEVWLIVKFKLFFTSFLSPLSPSWFIGVNFIFRGRRLIHLFLTTSIYACQYTGKETIITVAEDA